MGDSLDPSVATQRPVSRQYDEARQSLSGGASATEVKRRSVRGGAATVLGQGLGMALQMGSTVVLARLLTPSDYGLQGMVFTLTGFFSLFKDAGLSVATVQRESLTEDQISTLFWINLAVGVVLMILVASLGPFLVVFYKEPRLLLVTMASATVFLFNSLAVQHRALLDRSMRFATTAKIDLLSLGIGAAVGITMAAFKCGYWSLVGQAVTSPIVGMAGVWIAMPWRPGGPKRSTGVRSLVRFGGTVTLNSFVVYIAYNAEKILLGRYWGAAALGLYGRAYQLANQPVQQLTGSIGTVAFPALSRLQGDTQRLCRFFLKAHSIVISLTVPVVIGCALFADEIIAALLGPKWVGTAVVLRLLAPTVLVFALVNPLSWLLRATGRVGRSLKIALVICPVVILGIVAGLRYGPPGVAIGYSTAMLLLAVPLVAWAKHGTGVSTLDYLNSIKRPLVSGALGGFAGWLCKVFLHGTLAPLPLLIVGLTVAFAVYAFVLLIVMGQKEVYADLLSHLLQRDRAVPAGS